MKLTRLKQAQLRVNLLLENILCIRKGQVFIVLIILKDSVLVPVHADLGLWLS